MNEDDFLFHVVNVGSGDQQEHFEITEATLLISIKLKAWEYKSADERVNLDFEHEQL